MNTKATSLLAAWLARFLGLLLGLAGCSSLKTTFDYDTHTDFSAYHRFEWVERGASEPSSELVYDRIVKSVDAELSAKGYVQGADPDFRVAARTGSESRVSVTDWGYNYGPYGNWYPRHDVSIQEYEVGTLILDVVDAKTKKLVWRGTAEDSVLENPSREELDELVQRAVKELLASFPPDGSTDK